MHSRSANLKTGSLLQAARIRPASPALGPVAGLVSLVAKKMQIYDIFNFWDQLSH